ncbi:MAG: hypothetical protein WC750_06210 [Patescibacteria group bacterium]|jgi:hypothetical protein
MQSIIVLKIFIVEFVLLALWALAEQNWPTFLYGVGGAVLNVGVLWAMAR